MLGEAPNLAARLHALASPNAVVVASSTRHLVGEYFAFEDLGLHELKGFEVPVPGVAGGGSAGELTVVSGQRDSHNSRPSLAATTIWLG